VLRSASTACYRSGVTITDVAREMSRLTREADTCAALGEPALAQRIHDEAAIARAEVERRLAALFAAGRAS
jgi:hypothetical protein